MVRETGVFGESWSAETRFSRVDYRDVAEVAAIALTDSRLLYGTYQLFADGHLNRHDVANLMGQVLERSVRALTSEHPDTGGAEPSPMQPMFDWYDRRGLLGNALVLRAVLGREPPTLRAYLEELAAEPVA